jgi:hypothetical protein
MKFKYLIVTDDSVRGTNDEALLERALEIDDVLFSIDLERNLADEEPIEEIDADDYPSDEEDESGDDEE